MLGTSMKTALNKWFRLDAHQTTPRREAIAGTTTFLTMAYIIFVNPEILSQTGMDKGALITATILASAFGTLLSGLWANVPFAMAPGMGLNAFFAFSLVIGKQITWQTALGVVFVSGVLFFVLTLCGVRTKVIQAIPLHLRLAIAAGIGLFITFIGFQNLGLVVKSEATMVHLADRLTLSTGLGLVGLLTIAILEVRQIKGAILIGILTTTLLALVFLKEVTLPATPIGMPHSLAPILGQLDIPGALRFGLWGAAFSFMFVDLFDSVGTIVACSYQADLVNDDGSIPNIDRILEADATATLVGAVLGTSTTTTYIESGTGIAEGARTGLANVVTAAWFLVALLFTPVIGMVPPCATAPALVIVGVYMFRNVARIDFTRFHTAVPAFLTMALMPLTYSISTGLAFGFVSHILISTAAGKTRDIHPVMWGIGLFSLLSLVLELV
jgi:AGZA family xanthine/uracil permease-like MFS transporter